MMSRSDLSRIIYSATLFAAIIVIAMIVWQNQARVESAILTTRSETLPNFDIRDFSGPLERSAIYSPEVKSVLGERRGRSRVTVLKDFIARRSDLFGLDEIQTRGLQTTADYTNPDGKLSFVSLTQSIGGIPVFQGEVKAGFKKNGEMFRVVNNLAPNIEYRELSKEFGIPETAVHNAAQHVGLGASEKDTILIDSESNETKTTFRSGQFSAPTTAEKMYFPVSAGVVKPSWRVLLWTSGDAYYLIVDAVDGTLFWRKSITEKQTVNATFRAYTTPFGLMRTADSPTPGTPACPAPIGCAQPSIIGRVAYVLVGNEPPDTFNNLGWIPDMGLPVRTPADPNITDGNNVEAGIDRDGTNGVDPQGHAVGNPTRVFSPVYNPAPGNPPPGDDPTPPNPQTYPPTPFQQGVTTHAFYTANRWHDAMYRLGFNEAAGNFQHFNFGRGGSEGDRLSFEVQDGSGTNGANFSTPADGGRGRMQMFLWTGPTPDRDGALDSTVVVHELTHGLTGRLHGNATGLSTNMGRGMGEGWSDFYAAALLSEPADPVGVHALGGYITYQILPGFESNHYYGLRRFPLAVKAFTGPNGRPHDPLTFGYLNSNCNVLIGTTSDGPNSAYPRGPIGVNTCDQIHNMGEVWSTILWEVRAQLIFRHRAAEGNRRALQYVTDGMKLSPINPTMIQARDSILVAIQATDPSDLHLALRGFAIRGMGSSSAVINPGNGANNTVVAEAFDMPAAYRRPPRADFDGDGRTDISVFRPSDRNWYLLGSTAGFSAANWGLATDVPIPADFDGDNKADIAVYRDGSGPDNSVFYILKSSDATISIVNWGVAGDVPAVEEYDGDGKYDIAVFRPSTQTFWVSRSSNGVPLVSVSHRTDPTSRPITGDFDGDGKADFGTVKNGHWIIYVSQSNYSQDYFLQLTNNDSDRLIPADYDGDGVDDLAFYRPSNGTWTIRRSSGGIVSQQFGISTDQPSPGDYNGDGIADIAVFRNGEWWINLGSAGVVVANFGLAGDIPMPASNTQ